MTCTLNLGSEASVDVVAVDFKNVSHAFRHQVLHPLLASIALGSTVLATIDQRTGRKLALS